MKANRVLLQRKYARVVAAFASSQNISKEEALDFFYHSDLYQEMSQGIADMHCRSDIYLVEELQREYVKQQK
ncbi:DUF3791 domain-containing protein [Anaerovorax odorimutans]|uniref:DUF3791 domain-containing protein n=1 Tax=Anaerovorax odorimutans TaxID=109327 RepID=A0ABT1RLB2_9FIRM|nr:DUF3791 domain-containing protein [Anaerovorax odorimutans]MCQ4635976.1 DUF3791 domain-containing protein [Anaerovorax odorimutans]